MSVKIHFSTPLLKTTGGERELLLDSTSVEQLIGDLEKQFPELISTVCDREGRLKGNVSVYLNDRDIRLLEGVQTKLNDGDEVFFIPTIAGG